MPRRKSNTGSPPKGRVIINPDIQFGDDDICCLLFGMNMEQFIKDICDNKSGKYDNLYIRDNEKYEQTCKKRSENAKVRWDKNEDAKNANGCNCINEDAKNADTDTDKDTDTDTDKDTDKDIHTSQPAKPSCPSPSNPNVETVVGLYHEICRSYPKIKAISEARRKAVRARLRTYSLGEFRTVFSKAEESDFLKGKNNRNWSATFDWIVKDSNFAKILDGNYDNKSHTGSCNDNSGVDKYKCVINQFTIPEEKS